MSRFSRGLVSRGLGAVEVKQGGGVRNQLSSIAGQQGSDDMDADLDILTTATFSSSSEPTNTHVRWQNTPSQQLCTVSKFLLS